MARQETIEVKLAKSDSYKSTYTQLKDEAKELERLYANLRIGGGNQSSNSQAAAARAAAQAAQQAAQAQTAQANATAANLRVQREQVNLYNAQQRTVRDLNDAQAANIRVQTEQVNLQTAQIRQQNAIQTGNARQTAALRNLGQLQGQVNQGQAQNIQQMTQWIHANTNLTNATVTATGTIRNAVGTFQTYNAAMAEAGGVTHNYRIAVNTLNGEVYQLDKGIKTTALSLTDLSVIFRAIRTIVGFTGIAQSFRSAFSEMQNMSDAMAEYRKVTGATADEMESLRTQAYEVAKAYGQSASDVIASAANMARAGYKENSLAMAELATKTKLVGDMTQEAADKFLIAVDAAYKYQGNVEQLSAVLDAANALDNQYATTIEKISDGMTLVASLASTAHVPIEQLMAALGTMTAVTQRSGQETARGLRSILLHVIGDTSTEIEEGVTATEEGVKSLTDALVRYGDESIEAAAKAGKIINPMEAIVALQKAWKEGLLTEKDLSGIIKDEAGQRYYNVFSALIQNPEMYNDMLQSIATSMGSAQNEIDILMDSWSKKFEKLKTTWTQMVNQSISEGFIKDLIDGATAALEFAGSLENIAVSAIGAWTAIRALSTGLSNLSHGGQFGGFNIGMGILGLGISAIGIWKSAYEKSIKDIQAAAAESVSKALEQATSVKTIESLVNQYKEIASDGIQEEKGEIEKLKTLQEELNGLVGEQATAIDLVNGQYDITIGKLQKMTEEQKAAAEMSLRTALSSAVSAFNQSDLNGFFKTALDDRGQWENGVYQRYSMTSIDMTAYANEVVQDYIDSLEYLRVFGTLGGDTLFFKKPDNAEDIVAFYKEVQDFYTFLGSTTATGEKAANGAKSLGEEYSSMYTALGNFIKTIKEAGAGDVESAFNALETLNQELEDTGGSNGTAEEAAQGLEEVAETAYTLADAIDAATEAKKAFDDAMKNSKADALNGYITAFETLQKEIDAGRVNSTAYYASARMMLGEEAYNLTGGTAEGVRAAMNRQGQSGSVYDAWKILTDKYYDQEGHEIEGWGLYQLLTQTKGFTGNLLTEEGNAFIPKLTAQDIEQISADWGGLSKELILAVHDALDQSDIYGAATDANVRAGKPSVYSSIADSGKTDAETKGKAAEKETELAQAQEDLGESAEQASEQVEQATETLKEAKETAEEAAKEEEPGEPAPEVPDVTKAIEDAQKWLETLEDIEAAYLRIIQNARTIEELDAIELAITGDDKPLDSVIATALQKKRESIVLGVNANTNAADKKINDTAKKERTAVINTEAEEADLTNTSEKIDAVANEPRNAIITAEPVTENAQKKIDEVAEPRPSFVIATATNVDKTSRAIDQIAEKKRNATITIQYEVKGGSGSGYIPTDLTGTPNSPNYNSNLGSGGGFAGDPPFYEILNGGGIPITKKATGTRNHPGGYSLVNDGNGPELIVENDQAFIAGNGEPTIINLEKGAKVFTASETRAILNGSGIPAYADGTNGNLNKPKQKDGGNDSDNITLPNNPKDVIPKGKDGNEDSGNKGGNKGGGKKGTSYKFDDLKDLIDYILDKLGESIDDQIKLLDKQIETLKKEREQKEQEDELKKKQENLAEAENNRVVRYIDENGQWHWMADQNKVKKAKEDLEKYEDELAFNKKIDAIEKQKQDLQDSYNEITKLWSGILDAINTPTGDLEKILADLLKNGSDTDKKGAETVRDLLIEKLLKGGGFGEEYEKILELINRAAKGDPVMPELGNSPLSDLLSSGGIPVDGNDIENALMGAEIGNPVGGGYTGILGGGTQINYNYYIDGMKIGEDMIDRPLSEILRELTVHTESQTA